MDRFLCEARRDWAPSRDCLGGRAGGGEQLARGQNAGDEADTVSLKGVDLFGEEEQAQRVGAADRARKALGAPTSGDATIGNIGEGEARVVGGESHVSGQRQFEARRKRTTSNDRDGRLGNGRDCVTGEARYRSD